MVDVLELEDIMVEHKLLMLLLYKMLMVAHYMNTQPLGIGGPAAINMEVEVVDNARCTSIFAPFLSCVNDSFDNVWMNHRSMKLGLFRDNIEVFLCFDIADHLKGIRKMIA